MTGSRAPEVPRSSPMLNVASLRERFSTLQQPLAFFDGPGGTQCPDTVIDAISDYLRYDNANVGGKFSTSVRSAALVELAHETAGRFLGCQTDCIAFGQSMTSMNFLLSRAFARELHSGDEVLVTELDHDANVSPWLQLALDHEIEVRRVEVRDDLSLDLDDLAAKLSERTRVVAFPVAANSVGSVCDVRAVVELAHAAGALAWADGVHFAPHGPIDVMDWGVDVLLCSAYKFFGPHLGVAYATEDLLAAWQPYKIRPAPDCPSGRRYELGTPQHELLSGFVAAIDYLDSIGWAPILAHEQALGERFLAQLPEQVKLYGASTMHGRVPTFAFNLHGQRAEDVARRLAEEHGIAVWWGNHYAVEIIKRLGVDPVDGTVRAGFVHYNTAEEVDRLIRAIQDLLDD